MVTEVSFLHQEPVGHKLGGFAASSSFFFFLLFFFLHLLFINISLHFPQRYTSMCMCLAFFPFIPGPLSPLFPTHTSAAAPPHRQSCTDGCGRRRLQIKILSLLVLSKWHRTMHPFLYLPFLNDTPRKSV